MTRSRSATLLLILTLAVAACGGQAATDTAASTAPEVTPAAATDAPAAPTEAPAAPTEAPAAPTEAPAGGGSGGGPASGSACDLITTAEAGDVLGRPLSISMDTPGGVAFCIYGDETGNAVIATSWMTAGGSAAFSVMKTGSGVDSVSGIGDDAAFDPSTAGLYVLVGDSVLSVVAGDGREPEAQRRDWAEALARIAVDRLR